MNRSLDHKRKEDGVPGSEEAEAKEISIVRDGKAEAKLYIHPRRPRYPAKNQKTCLF